MNAPLVDSRLIVFPSPLGWVGIVHRQHVLHALRFGDRNQDELESHFSDHVAQYPQGTFELDLASRLQAFLGGQESPLDNFEIETAGMTPFRVRVTAACRQIPYGTTRTYAELAAASGNPTAARAVGQVMRTNPLPVIVPCHRVIGASGKMVGYSAASGVDMKRQLLDLETTSLF